MSQRNDKRNKELVQLRKRNPKKWTFGELGNRYKISEAVASRIFKRDQDRF